MTSYPARKKNRKLCLMKIDIDNFHQVNDAYGHYQADPCYSRSRGKFRIVCIMKTYFFAKIAMSFIYC